MKQTNLFSCIVAAVLTFAAASCSSDEVTNNNKGNGDCLPGSAVSFGGTRTIDAGAAKRTYYGTPKDNIPTYWSNGDAVRIASNGGSALYVVPDDVGANATKTTLEYKEGQEDGTAITWQEDGGAQTFYAFYPGSESTLIGENGAVDIAVPDNQSGSQNYDRDNLATADDDAHPLAFAIAAATATPEDGSVTLPFTDFMNVVRIQVNNASGYPIKKVRVFAEMDGKVREMNGTATVTATPGTNAVSVSNLNTVSEEFGVYANVEPSNAATTQDYIFYLLPKDYSEGFKIEVTYDAGDGTDAIRTKSTTTYFAQGQLMDITFNTQPANSVDLGVRVISEVAGDGTVTTLWAGTADAIANDGDNAEGIDGDGATTTIASIYKTAGDAKPLYFATGNLIVSKKGVYYRGRIGSPTEVITDADYTDDNTERDLFGWADITGWKTSTNNDNYPSPNSPAHISGNPSYDIARAIIGDGTTSNTTWRLPTAAEWSVLMQQVAVSVSTEDTWRQGYSSNGTHSDVWSSSNPQGLTITSKVSGFTSNSIFIPAAGYRIYGTTVNNRGTHFAVWSGTYENNVSYQVSYSLQSRSTDWRVSTDFRYYGISVRPVSE